MDREKFQSDAVKSSTSLVPELPDGYFEAGKRYCQSLARLSFKPELAIWARDSTIDDWVLLLSTSLLDAVGPLKIMETLFEAYDSKGTPPEISPFIIRLQSPLQNQMRVLIHSLEGGMRPRLIFETETGEQAEMPQTDELMHLNQTQVDDLAVQAGWRYVVGREINVPANPFKAFKTFRRQVEALAA